MFHRLFSLFLIAIHIFIVSSEIENNFDSSLYEGVDKKKLDDFYRIVRNSLSDSTDSWDGRWFPDNTNEHLSRHRPPLTSDSRPAYVTLKEQQHINSISQLIQSDCDDGKTNLTMDWDGSPEEYLCLLPPYIRFLPDSSLPAIEKKHLIPPAYSAPHKCMDKEIKYDEPIVTYGVHRPAWPVYGEYKYVPPQRWLHNLEHGAIVMLYHPCAHPSQVNMLKTLLRSCLFRHIITPSRRLPPERPLALLSWGWSLSMSEVSPILALNFIKTHALHGPEDIIRDGDYSYKLIQRADLVSDESDSRLCPYSF